MLTNRKFIIEDELHCEWIGEFTSFADALKELKYRSTQPWDSPANVAPCTSWQTCERQYLIIEYDNRQEPWTEINKTYMCTVSHKGVVWDYQS